eukprot:Gb_39559 [translate_table: standard]
MSTPDNSCISQGFSSAADKSPPSPSKISSVRKKWFNPRFPLFCCSTLLAPLNTL